MICGIFFNIYSFKIFLVCAFKKKTMRISQLVILTGNCSRCSQPGPSVSSAHNLITNPQDEKHGMHDGYLAHVFLSY